MNRPLSHIESATLDDLVKAGGTALGKFVGKSRVLRWATPGRHTRAIDALALRSLERKGLVVINGLNAKVIGPEKSKHGPAITIVDRRQYATGWIGDT